MRGLPVEKRRGVNAVWAPCPQIFGGVGHPPGPPFSIGTDENHFCVRHL
jgi:hypothetical protein